MELHIAIAGNPNVGKSTIFNALTGLRRHTGNWAGKTVSLESGEYRYNGRNYLITDLPGCYSLDAISTDEDIARDFICSGEACVCIAVCDATCLERSLNLALQIADICPNLIICVNLLDEARSRGIEIDIPRLSELTGYEVIGASGKTGEGLEELRSAVERMALKSDCGVIDREACMCEPLNHIEHAAEICKHTVTKGLYTDRRDRIIDKIITGRFTAFPVMALLLALILWITIVGANYPSALLSKLLFGLEDSAAQALIKWGTPAIIVDIIIHGMYRVTAWVVSVMLPPMAIFFPLFTLLEDLGLLPRIAYNTDRCFACCNACGKQSLTMCMGLGCNAAGVTGCRIIDSPRERLIAIITNSFIPCNGRFPTIIALTAIFFSAGRMGSMSSALMLSAVIALGAVMTLLASKLLSVTLLRGIPSSFTLELPPYRVPKIGSLIVRSMLDRTLFVLGRAIAVAAPCGLIISIAIAININGASLLSYVTNFFDPIARLLGLDGVILTAFIFGIPANEIVLPIILTAYLSEGVLASVSDIGLIGATLTANGWTLCTAVCFILFSLMHWPCSTTLITIYRETKSLKWTLTSFLLPTLFGMAACILVNAVWGMLV